MYVPNGDCRYFAAGTDQNLIQHIPMYSAEEYEREYPRIESTKPLVFSINLRDDIAQWLVNSPPLFEVALEDVISLGCYYYCDWDTVVAVTDEFLQAEIVERVRKNWLQIANDARSCDEAMTEMTVALGGAITRFIDVIIGVLSRTGAPAIMDYGCCYRLRNIDNLGNVFFELRNPPQVYADLAGSPIKDNQHCEPY